MKKSPIEKILLLILFVLALPFILGFVAIFLIVYVIGFLVEGIFYFKSKYYQTFKERYFLFVTRTSSYKKFVNATKDIDVTFHNNLVVTDTPNYFLIEYENYITYNKELGEWQQEDKNLVNYLKTKYTTSKDLLIIVRREQFNKDDYLLAKEDELFIFIDK